MSSVSGASLRTYVRRRKSSVIACGNFGAGPNPPNCGSYCARTESYARARCSGDGAGPSPVAPRLPVRSTTFVSFPACSTKSPRRVRHASSTASSTLTNPGMPWRSSLGKYVPPKNGRPSGARKTVIGHPPRPVIACTACM
jgi:hypothetical protein